MIHQFILPFRVESESDVKKYPSLLKFLTYGFGKPQNFGGKAVPAILGQKWSCATSKERSWSLLSESFLIFEIGWIGRSQRLIENSPKISPKCPVTQKNGGLGKKCLEQKVLIFCRRIRIRSQNIPFHLKISRNGKVPPKIPPTAGFWGAENIFIGFLGVDLEYKRFYSKALSWAVFEKKIVI